MKKEDIKDFLGGVDVDVLLGKADGFNGIDEKMDLFEETITKSKRSESRNEESLNELAEEKLLDDLMQDL